MFQGPPIAEMTTSPIRTFHPAEAGQAVGGRELRGWGMRKNNNHVWGLCPTPAQGPSSRTAFVVNEEPLSSHPSSC